MRDEAELLGVASRVVAKAAAGGVRLVTAESVTGGMVGGYLTGVAGASRVYGGGIVSYGNGAKIGLLGVSRSVLVREGAVSACVARAMVRGVLAREEVWGGGRLLGVAVTGYAGGVAGGVAGGLAGGAAAVGRVAAEVGARAGEEEIGLVFVGVGFAEAKGEEEISVAEHRLRTEEGREAVRREATLLALEALEHRLSL